MVVAHPANIARFGYVEAIALDENVSAVQLARRLADAKRVNAARPEERKKLFGDEFSAVRQFLGSRACPPTASVAFPIAEFEKKHVSGSSGIEGEIAMTATSVSPPPLRARPRRSCSEIVQQKQTEGVIHNARIGIPGDCRVHPAVTE